MINWHAFSRNVHMRVHAVDDDHGFPFPFLLFPLQFSFSAPRGGENFLRAVGLLRAATLLRQSLLLLTPCTPPDKKELRERGRCHCTHFISYSNFISLTAFSFFSDSTVSGSMYVVCSRHLFPLFGWIWLYVISCVGTIWPGPVFRPPPHLGDTTS